MNVDRSKIKLFKENDIVISEGSTDPEMYKIISGKAAVYFEYGTDAEYFVGVLGEGRCFGETGILTGKPSPFSVVAVTDLMVLGISADEFPDFIREEPEKAIEIMTNMSRTIDTMSANINMLKEEMFKAISDHSEEQRINEITKSILKYRVSGLQGSPYFTGV